MAIFQPTNITPDLISGVENGLVIIPGSGTDPVDVSWQVNGNSKLVKYQIDFYRNLPNEASPIMSTGEVTLGTPFSPVGADGTTQRFTCQVPFSYFDAAAVALAGYTGKMKITQWWSDGSVVQRSLSVFRKAPASSFGIASVSGYNGIYYFTGAFSNAQTSTTLLWTRWTAETSGNVVYDTGKVWGATSYEWSPGVFYPGDYTVTFTAESNVGEQLSDTATFTSMPSVTTIEGIIGANCDRSMGAVAVDINPQVEEHLPAVVDGSPTVSDGKLNVGAGDSVTWTIPNLFDGNRWAFVWEGTAEYIIGQSAANIVSITQKDGTTFGIQYDGNGKLVMVYPNGSVLVSNFGQRDVFRFVVLYNDSIPVPQYVAYFGQWDDQGQTYSYALQSMTGFVPSNITSVTLRGAAETIQWGIVYGDRTTALMDFVSDYSQESPFGDGPYIGYEPAPAPAAIAAQIYMPWTLFQPLYRVNPDGSVRKIAELVPGEQYPTVYDYEAANGQSYTYFLLYGAFDENEQEETVTMLTTGSVAPCIWEWDLIEAENTKGSGTNVADYTPVNVFRFRANVQTGAIGNGASPSVYSTFTRYPAVLRDTQNRKSGTLTGLIGWVTAPGQYSDDNATMDAIRNLSATKNTLFLRSRRGEFLKVAISGEISTTANDNSPKQEITASVPWVEVGPVDGSVAKAQFIYPDPEEE